MNRKLFFFILSFCLVFQVNAQNGNSSKVIVDNPKLKVTEYISVPGADVCGKGIHTHVPHLTILLSDAEVEITTSDGKKINQTVPAGTSFWSEAESHAIINKGKKEIRVQIVELK